MAEDEPPVRWLFSTSGTTADPKVARHTDKTIMATARGMSDRLDYGADDQNGLAFPFTHIGGITWLFSSLLTGGGNILMEAFDPNETPEVFRREGVTIAGSGTPFHMAYVAAQRANPERRLFPNLKNCTGGGAPKPPQLHYDVKEVLGGPGILSGYGLTEAPILTMSTASDGDEALAESEGKAMPGVELKLVTIEGKVCGIGEEGEVRAKAPQLMLGYLDESLHADAFDEDGYFRSGDLGVLDARGQPQDHRSPQGHHHPPRREHLGQGGRGPPLHAPGDRRRRRDRPARPEDGGAGVRDRGAQGGCVAELHRDAGLPEGEGPAQPGRPRAARDRRGGAPQPGRQDPEARAPRAVRGLDADHHEQDEPGEDDAGGHEALRAHRLVEHEPAGQRAEHHRGLAERGHVADRRERAPPPAPACRRWRCRRHR